MRARHLPFIVLFLLIAALAALNWPVMMSEVPLNLLFSTVQTPIGGVMILILITVALVFSVNMMVWQASVLAENRQHAKELQQQRVLADQAEASRFTELGANMQAQFSQLSARIERTEGAILAEISASGNATLATLAELDDRIARHKGVGA